MSLIKIDPQKSLLAQNQKAKALRQAAYVAESDPLFFKAQRGEATMEEYLAKVAEIKSRYPSQDEPSTV